MNLIRTTNVEYTTEPHIKVIANDDIDNIKVSFGKGHAEYYSLRTDNEDGVSKLYIYI